MGLTLREKKKKKKKAKWCRQCSDIHLIFSGG